MALMTLDSWKKVSFFRPTEAWGDWRNLDEDLIFGLDALRAAAGKPIVVHNAYATSGHTEGSYHYRGMAADVHIVGMHVVDQFLLASRLPNFGGIGVYPFWSAPGLHLDVGQPGRRWARNKAGVYLPLNWEFLRGLR